MINEIHEEQANKDTEEGEDYDEDEEELPPPISPGEAPRTPEELENWRIHKAKGRGRRVIISAEIDLATKSAGNIDVDLWYANLYELFNSGWDLGRYA